MRLPLPDRLLRAPAPAPALAPAPAPAHAPAVALGRARAGARARARALAPRMAMAMSLALVAAPLLPGDTSAVARAEPPAPSSPRGSSNPAGHRAPASDPLLDRLDALGITDHPPSHGDAGAADGNEGAERSPRAADLELHLVSDPEGYGLLAARALETGVGTQRGLCRAPCTTFIDPGTYRLVVENRRGRDRPVRGLVPLLHDGELELHIESRRPARVAYWSASLGLIAGGLALFIYQRQPVPNGDPYCEINCFTHTARQRALMTVGGLTAMFGGITLRFGLTARDYGRVVFHPVRARRSPLPEAPGAREAGE